MPQKEWMMFTNRTWDKLDKLKNKNMQNCQKIESW